MKKRKNNIITSIALIFAIILMALLPLPVAHAANFSVSKSNISIETGKTSTITVNALTHTGRLDINSSNSEIAISNENNLWVENNSKTIKISAKLAGTATITISGELYDSSTETEEKFSKTIKVTVIKPVVSESTNTSGNNNSSGTTTGNNNGNVTTTENTINTNVKPNISTNTSGSQNNNTSNPNFTTTNKPSSSTSSKPETSSKPTTQSSNIEMSKPSNIATTIQTDKSNTEISETVTEIEENIEKIGNEMENVSEEKTEEISQEEATIEQEQATVEINNMEEARKVKVNSKIIIIAIIGIIAIAMIFIGIGVSKNIFKK